MIKKYKWKTGVPDQYVHVMGRVAGGEFTLCGDSFDIDETDFNVPVLTGGLIEINSPINCPICIDIIKYCKNIRLPKGV